MYEMRDNRKWSVYNYLNIRVMFSWVQDFCFLHFFVLFQSSLEMKKENKLIKMLFVIALNTTKYINLENKNNKP